MNNKKQFIFIGTNFNCELLHICIIACPQLKYSIKNN